MKSTPSLNSFLDIFLPAHLNETFDYLILVKFRAFVLIVLMNITGCLLTGLLSTQFEFQKIGLLFLVICILFSVSVLALIKLSGVELISKINLFFYFFCLVIAGVTLLGVYFDLRAGIFAGVWFFPILLMSSLLFSPKITSVIFGVLVTGIAHSIYLKITGENYTPMVMTLNNDLIFSFYLLMSFILTFIYLIAYRKFTRDLIEKHTEDAGKTVEKVKYESLALLSTQFAHEVNNPLFRLQSGIDILVAKIESGSFDMKMIAKTQSDVEATIKYISSLSKNLSEYAKETPETSMSLLKLETPLLAVIDLLKDKMLQTDSVIELYVEENLEIISYPSALKQIMINYLTAFLNLSKISGKKVFQIKAETQGEWVTISLILREESYSYLKNMIETIHPDKLSPTQVKYVKMYNVASNLVGQLDGNVKLIGDDNQVVIRIELPTYEE